MASAAMAGLWPLRLRSLHADFCDCERVSEQSDYTLKVGTITFFMWPPNKHTTRLTPFNYQY
ncbi:hypothetical protein CCE29_11200 [Lacticaseibacillus rhamnosus]|uniref:Uncharacterized protein n=1 Tax=Lacticaseibacillus rhamnosus (strain ATCC 53103 / LMG 18243 / GG) TaxID=568703 RepID=A0A809N930_LACRG|nr:hypothetical protein B4583_08720 [Lacticaseibacillus rhamnosus]AXI95034.1 hypothetical protein DU507_11325 [Lacticaseibacillus rhamnosus GG]ART96474.1 hypothetical protein CCE29_11200 [Lacticaseibacillus rhamnosus]AZZ23704.1 hypothetical protein CYG41_11290 [Lacticaseibacillus rhamnosus]MBB1164008.1 hypothetical protein [Lacticaseibacillus rhamnosus]